MTTETIAAAPPETASPPAANRPISIYEVHLDSWMRVPEDHNRPLTCAEIAPKLADYVKRLNFTHVELVPEPVASPRRMPKDIALLIDQLHKNGIGVIFDRSSSIPNTVIQELHVDGLRNGDATTLLNGNSGRTLKWDIAWSRDVLDYFAADPIRRKFHQQQLLSHEVHSPASGIVLPLSHDEMMPGRSSLLGRMPGDEWQKFANLRLLFGFMYAQPGKKLLFMGGEFGQWNEWNPGASLDWHLVREGSRHQELQHWLADLNYFYRNEPVLHPAGAHSGGFAWVETTNAEMSTFSWLWESTTGETVLAVCNCTPVPRHNYRIGVPGGGFWRELLNSDAREYGGSGQGNLGGVEASPFGWHSKSHSLIVTLPPLGIVIFKRTGRNQSP